jgi:glucosamine--fructose-6-phosphate aminotransferase (isomerizing)
MTDGRLAGADIAAQAAVIPAALEANAAPLAVARELVAGARVVRFLAFGSSRHAAGYGALALDVLGGVPAMVASAPGAAVPRAPFHPDTPVVVLSQSGRTPPLLDAARDAASAGAPVVAVTNEPGSPLEALADVTLGCGAGAEAVVAATKSVTAQAVLLRALAAPFDPARLRTAIDDALAADLTDAVRGDPPVAVVCSGFAAEWIADEIALKLAEMAGRAVSAEPLVEYLHGPVAAAGPVLAFVDAADPNAAALTGPEVVRVPTPTTGDPSLDAIVRLVLGQRIALAWAHRLGEDADAPRGLRKVTATR